MNKTQQLYYIDKVNDTYSDALLAVGFAKLLEVVQGKIGKRSSITIQDAGSCHIVESSTSVTPDDLQSLPKLSLVRPVNTKPKVIKEGEQEDEGEQASKSVFDNGFNYEEQKEISRTYYAAWKEFRGIPDLRIELEKRGITEPNSSLDHYRSIVQMKIASTFNDLTQRWDALGELQRDYIGVLFNLFQTPDNDIDAALDACQTLIKKAKFKQAVTSTALQIINPTTGKGANRTKANGVTNGESLDRFWPLEMLKFVGFMILAAPYTIQGSKDRKTYVLQPKHVTLSRLESIMSEFRTVCWSSTAVKLDVMASLRFTETFVEHRRIFLRDTQQQADEDEPYDETQVTSIAHGFEVASYKDMGSAYATMNISTINFPQWLRVETLEDAETTLALLKEHRMILQNIRTGNSEREEGAEEYQLLRAYRNFLSGNDLTPLWTFTTAYSSYLISQHEHEKNFKFWLRQLSTTGLEQIIDMTTTTQRKPLSLITSNPGFQRIAYAIRQATVKAQYQRSQEREREVRYDVNYGLGQDLMREVRYREKFIAALSSFLTRYNSETVREEEKLAVRLGGRITPETRRKYKLRGTVAISDIDEIVKLIDDFDAETVGSLLIAYGYASEPRGKYEASPNVDDGNTSPPPDDSSDNPDTLEENNE